MIFKKQKIMLVIYVLNHWICARLNGLYYACRRPSAAKDEG